MNIFEILTIISIASLIIIIPSIITLYKRLLKMKELVLTALKISNQTALDKVKKIRKRYIVFAIITDKCDKQQINKRVLEQTIRNKFREIFGETILIKADPQVIYYDPGTCRGVLRIAHIYKKQTIAILGVIRSINNTKVLIIPLKTTGTIKRARKILYSLRRELQI